MRWFMLSVSLMIGGLTTFFKVSIFSGHSLVAALPVAEPNINTQSGKAFEIQDVEVAATKDILSRWNRLNRNGDKENDGDEPNVPFHLAQIPSEATLTRLDGPNITLNGTRTWVGRTWVSPRGGPSILRVPARSGANIEFRPSGSSLTIPGYLVQAGYSLRNTEYWHPCNGYYGRFVMGWSTGGGAPTCSQVRLGRRLRISTQPSDRTVVGGIQQLSSIDRITASRLKANFPDTQGHWAETAIIALSDQGIITGYQDGRFRPNAPVSRAEFAAMVNKAFGNRAPIRSAQNFPDTSTHWARNAIRTAYALGFVSGYDDGLFRPEGDINRLEGTVALASGLAMEAECNRNILNNVYGDAGQVPDWACAQVTAATNNGIRVQGPNSNELNPSQTASRADIAMFIYQALQAGNGDNTTENATDFIVEPTGDEATWLLANVTDEKIEVIVLGGNVLVGPESTLKQVTAGERFTFDLTQQDLDSGTVTALSPEERTDLANSNKIEIFLDPNSWSPETGPQLSQFEEYRNALRDVSIDDDFVAQILRVHNRFRDEVGVSPLDWSDDIAISAQEWADFLAEQTPFEFQVSDSDYGENVWGFPMGQYSPAEMVERWGEQKQYFVPNSRFPNVSNTGNWRHVSDYTQMVWSSTTEVGCAIATGNGLDVLVCQYNPPGNINGERPYDLPGNVSTTTLPDLSIASLKLPPINQSNPQTGGQNKLTVTVENVGGTFISSPGQQ